MYPITLHRSSYAYSSGLTSVTHPNLHRTITLEITAARPLMSKRKLKLTKEKFHKEVILAKTH
jgi:hypothetical protein